MTCRSVNKIHFSLLFLTLFLVSQRFHVSFHVYSVSKPKCFPTILWTMISYLYPDQISVYVYFQVSFEDPLISFSKLFSIFPKLVRVSLYVFYKYLSVYILRHFSTFPRLFSLKKSFQKSLQVYFQDFWESFKNLRIFSKTL